MLERMDDRIFSVERFESTCCCLDLVGSVCKQVQCRLTTAVAWWWDDMAMRYHIESSLDERTKLH